jgi:hypothetical protein
MAQEMHG